MKFHHSLPRRESVLPVLTKNGEWLVRGKDYKRDGTIFVDKGSLIYAPYCQPKYQTGEGEFLRKLPDSELDLNH